MDANRIMEAVNQILAEADITVEEYIEFAIDHEKEEKIKPKPDPNQVLRAALVRAKDKTGLEYDDIGALVGGVTGGAVGHWARGRTNPNLENRFALLHWLRSVEDALGIDLLPENFKLSATPSVTVLEKRR